MLQETESQLRETESHLGKLPATPSKDTQGEIISLANGFAHRLTAYIEGTPDENGIHQKIRPLNKALVTAISSTARKFCPFEKDSKSLTRLSSLVPDDEPPTHGNDENATCIEEVTEMASEMIRLLFTMEKEIPWAVRHDPYFADCKEKLSQAHSKARRTPVLRYSTELKEELYHDSTDTYGADPYGQTLFYIADSWAYFQGLHLLPSPSTFQ